MALINCNECNQQISDKATTCPYCGSPLNDKSTTAVDFINELATSIKEEETKYNAKFTSEQIENHKLNTQEWWYKIPLFNLTKSSGVLGQIIIGTIIITLIGLFGLTGETIKAATPERLNLISLWTLVIYFPWFYISHTVSKTNRILTYIFYGLMIASEIYTYLLRSSHPIVANPF